MRELHVLRFISKQRTKKIIEKYKLAFSIIFDKTTLIYIGIAGIIGLFVLKDRAHYYSHDIQLININNDFLIIYFFLKLILKYFGFNIKIPMPWFLVKLLDSVVNCVHRLNKHFVQVHIKLLHIRILLL